MSESAEKIERVLRHPSQDRILDVAEELFAARGFSGVGLAELAERVALSKSSLFHHFPSKIEIYATVMERLFARLWESVEKRIDPEGDPLAEVEKLADAMVEFMGNNPASARLVLRALIERDFEDAGLTREEMAMRHGRYVASVVQYAIDTMRRGIVAGVIRKQSVGHFVQTLVGALLFHFASDEFGRQMTGELFDPERVAARKREIKAFLRAGLENK